MVVHLGYETHLRECVAIIGYKKGTIIETFNI